MTTTKRKTKSDSARFTLVKPDSPVSPAGTTLGKRLADAAHAMAIEHFRKVDESGSRDSVDRKAEKKINALFDKYAQDDETFQSSFDQLVNGG